MAKHFCIEHDTAFFKRGKMKGYAHPIQDKDGEDTGEWCNEEEAETKPDKQTPSTDTNSSTEAQVAIKEIGEDWRAGKLEDNAREVLTYKNWIISKLGNWSSQGVEESSPTNELKVEVKPTTLEQRQRLSAIMKKWDAGEAQDILIERWHTNETKHLNFEQMEDFLTKLEKPIEPEEIPF